MSDLPLHRTMQDDEIGRLKAELTAAQSKIEALQSALVQAQGASACYDGYGRVCRIVSKALEQKGSSWLLRRQADAVNDIRKDLLSDLPVHSISKAVDLRLGLRVDSLREKAEKVERGE